MVLDPLLKYHSKKGSYWLCHQLITQDSNLLFSEKRDHPCKSYLKQKKSTPYPCTKINFSIFIFRKQLTGENPNLTKDIGTLFCKDNESMNKNWIETKQKKQNVIEKNADGDTPFLKARKGLATKKTHSAMLTLPTPLTRGIRKKKIDLK